MSNRELLLRARSHFRATRTPETLEKIAVPEWDTDIHFWPEMSVDEKRAVFSNLKIGGDDIPAAGLIDAAVIQVQLRSRDAFGNRLFSDGDEAALRDTDPEVLQRISNAMGFGARLSLEDAEGN
jgi:hypothetical protein